MEISTNIMVTNARKMLSVLAKFTKSLLAINNKESKIFHRRVMRDIVLSTHLLKIGSKKLYLFAKSISI